MLVKETIGISSSYGEVGSVVRTILPIWTTVKRFVFTISVELHADAIIRIAAEESPEDDDQRDDGDTGDYVEPISAEESGGSDFEDDEKTDNDRDALQWTASQNPRRPRGHVSELLIRRKFRDRLCRSVSGLRGLFYRLRSAALPAMRVFVFDSVATVATAPHNGDRY